MRYKAPFSEIFTIFFLQGVAMDTLRLFRNSLGDPLNLLKAFSKANKRQRQSQRSEPQVGCQTPEPKSKSELSE